MAELSAQTARAALNQLLTTLVSPALAADTESLSAHPGQRIDRCIELLKADASGGAALAAEHDWRAVDALDPAGRPFAPDRLRVTLGSKLAALAALGLLSTFPFFMVGCASQTEEISTEEISKPFLMLNSETYQDQYGQPWPLEVESGKLYCVGYKISPDVVFETKGRVYAVNGNAASKMDGPSLWIGKTEIKSLKYGKINEIRKTNPKGAMYGLMSVSAMIREGINLCAEN